MSPSFARTIAKPPSNMRVQPTAPAVAFLKARDCDERVPNLLMPHLQGRRLHRLEVLSMIKRRARQAGLPYTTCCHTFRATGITTYLQNGGTIEHAQQIADHESSRTTKLYDRANDVICQDEIERILIQSPDLGEVDCGRRPKHTFRQRVAADGASGSTSLLIPRRMRSLDAKHEIVFTAW